MFKTYFCKLVLGFSPNRNQTTAEMFSGQWPSIIIKKNVEISTHFWNGAPKHLKVTGQFYEKGYNSWTKLDIFTKLGTHM